MTEYGLIVCLFFGFSLQRVLVEDAQESPFNSFYGPARKEGLLYAPWFFLSEVAPVGNTTASGNWTYFFMEVPRGAAGAVLSVQLRHVVQATMSIYARLEGIATPEHWDFKMMNIRENNSSRRRGRRRRRTSSQGSFSQVKNNKLSLDLLYPAEGIWCIGVHYEKHSASAKDSSLENYTPQQLGIGRLVTTRIFHRWRSISKSFVHWYQSFIGWLRISWRKFCSTIYSYNTRALKKASRNMTNNEADIGLFLKNR